MSDAETPEAAEAAEAAVARRSPESYDQSGEFAVLAPGDKLFIPCVGGGPCTSRLETFPPTLEIEEATGTYVLDDDGPRDTWRYVWVPR